MTVKADLLINHIRQRRLGGAGPSTAANDLIWIRIVLDAAKVGQRLPIPVDVVDEAREYCLKHRLIAKSKRRERRPTNEELEKLDGHFQIRDRHKATVVSHIALLIDCDNANPAAIEGILGDLVEQGTINIRRAYADWSKRKNWQPKLLPHAIQPIQQFVYRKGKDAVDMCMMIDAMELLYTERVDCFALVTNDGDFTPLVHKLLSKGKVVIVFGKKTSDLLIQACSFRRFSTLPRALGGSNLRVGNEQGGTQSPHSLRR